MHSLRPLTGGGGFITTSDDKTLCLWGPLGDLIGKIDLNSESDPIEWRFRHDTTKQKRQEAEKVSQIIAKFEKDNQVKPLVSKRPLV